MSIRHRVEQGDSLASIAKQYGFGDWRKIYDHPDNQALKQKRKSPHILMPGDVVFIPDKEEASHECATGKVHRFLVRRPRVWLRIKVQLGIGEPAAGKRYELDVSGETLPGTTTDAGLVEQRIPPDAREATLRLYPEDEGDENMVTLSLRIGHLDPIEEKSGLRARLRNLGIPVADDGDQALAAALYHFQARCGLDKTATADDATKTRLLELHAC
jgi:LysM domain